MTVWASDAAYLPRDPVPPAVDVAPHAARKKLWEISQPRRQAFDIVPEILYNKYGQCRILPPRAVKG